MNTPLVFERIFNAPAEKVWKALTDLNQMKQWYFPQLENFKPEEGFETQFNVHNEGKDYLHIWKIKKVIPLKKIPLNGNMVVTRETP
ncbi:MAG TPA: SRPBCC domain-containing protein [Chitinophagaceae bacterium]|nr:SRPBCC domain-containing protein [Chitinophagaceae bacterium]